MVFTPPWREQLLASTIKRPLAALADLRPQHDDALAALRLEPANLPDDVQKASIFPEAVESSRPTFARTETSISRLLYSLTNTVISGSANTLCSAGQFPGERLHGYRTGRDPTDKRNVTSVSSIRISCDSPAATDPDAASDRAI